jgi:siroheme synthase (precorrin-2 oxidase/ferrochelatase)
MLPPVLSGQPLHPTDDVTKVIVVGRGMNPERLERRAARFIDAGANLVVLGRKGSNRKRLAKLAEARPPVFFFRREDDDVWTLIYPHESSHAIVWSAPGR